MMVRKHHAIFGCFKFRRLIAEDLFCDLSPAARKSLSAITETVHLDKEAVLIEKGDLFNVFVLTEGEAVAKYYNHLIRNKITTPIFIGEIVGLAETISNSYSMMRLETITPCVFERIARADLVEFLSQQQELSLKIVNELSLKLNESFNLIKS